jgi:hypothetical protein
MLPSASGCYNSPHLLNAIRDSPIDRTLLLTLVVEPIFIS